MTTATQRLIAYHGDPARKQRFLAELQWHREQDLLIKGTYGDFGRWKVVLSAAGQCEEQRFARGCAVACSLSSLARMDGLLVIDTQWHSLYEPLLGWPVWLAYLEDELFERLPDRLAFDFPYQLSEAVPVGADLSWVLPRFMLCVLRHCLEHGSELLDRTCRDHVRRAIELFQRLAAGEVDAREECLELVGVLPCLSSANERSQAIHDGVTRFCKIYSDGGHPGGRLQQALWCFRRATVAGSPSMSRAADQTTIRCRDDLLYLLRECPVPAPEDPAA